MNIEERLKNIEERLDALEKLLISTPVVKSPVKKMSAKEFLLDKKPKSEIETTFYLGYFMEKIEGKVSFNVEDIRSAFRAAKIALPKNISDTVNKNITKGYFMEAENKGKGQKSWVLTATGETRIEAIETNGQK